MLDFICEIGVNHENSLEKALKMIDELGTIKSDLVHISAKFQAYKATRLAVTDSPAYWDLNCEPTPTQQKLFMKYDSFDFRDYLTLKKACDVNSIEFLATAFDSQSLCEIDKLTERHKIASADITNVPLLREVSSKEKPILLSTGASTSQEISHAVNELVNSGTNNITLLHCMLNYPTPDNQASLSKITTLQDLFSGYAIGYSDHTVPDKTFRVLMASIAMGVTTIEKHYTFDKSLQGNDHYHSMDISDLISFCNLYSDHISILGDPSLELRSYEESARVNARRSIVTSEFIKKGTLFTPENLTTKRPGTGLSPILWDEIIGRTASTDLASDLILQETDVL